MDPLDVNNLIKAWERWSTARSVLRGLKRTNLKPLHDAGAAGAALAECISNARAWREGDWNKTLERFLSEMERIDFDALLKDVAHWSDLTDAHEDALGRAERELTEAERELHGLLIMGLEEIHGMTAFVQYSPRPPKPTRASDASDEEEELF